MFDKRNLKMTARMLQIELDRAWLLFIFGTILFVLGPSSVRSQDLPDAKRSESPRPIRADRGNQRDIDRDPAKAASLVRQLYDSEEWINSIRTLMIRSQINQVANKVRNPGQADYSRTETWMWDQSRMRHDHMIRDAKGQPITSSSSEIWDASRKMFDSRRNDTHTYRFGDDSGDWFARTATNSLFNAWKIASVNRFWWLATDIAQSRSDRFMAPEEFEMAGRDKINGHDCQVVQSPAGHLRFSIGIDDRRLYQHTILAVPPEAAATDPMELYRKIGGDKIRTPWHWQPWLESLDIKEQRRVLKEMATANIQSMLPKIVESFDDYREVQPGCWFPFLRRVDFNDFEMNADGKAMIAIATSYLDIHVDEMIVNEKIPDELFEIELKDGIEVSHDSRYDPPIRYVFQKDQTDDDRKSLALEEKMRREAAAIKRAAPLKTIKSRVGTAAPPLPQVGWIGGKALTWESLRGKVVILHFFDVTSEFTQSDRELPVMEIWHGKQGQTGVAVIGVHTPTKFTDQVEFVLNKFGVTYPVVIDELSDEEHRRGQLFDWFGAELCPFSVIVDQKGVVAGYGQLTGALAVDRNGLYYGFDESFLPAIAGQISKLIETK